MKTWITALVTLLILLPAQAFAQVGGEEDEKAFKVQAWDFSDPMMDAVQGDSCAEFLQYLMKSRANYKMEDITAVQGPPGVVYTLMNGGGDVAIVKCGLTGSDHGGSGCDH